MKRLRAKYGNEGDFEEQNDDECRAGVEKSYESFIPLVIVTVEGKWKEWLWEEALQHV